MKNLFCLFVFVLLILKSTANLYAQNLVSNPGFEEKVQCPSWDSQIEYSKGWQNATSSCDYYNVCCTKIDCNVPENLMGKQQAASGDAYSGFYTLGEIMLGTLTQQLEIGKKYFISFKISLCDRAIYGNNKIGVGFSTLPITVNTSNDISSMSLFYTNTIITDYENWTTVAGSFTADSSYNYIMIGNFFKATSLKKDSSLSPGADVEETYYYVDDVCLSEDSTCYAKMSYKKLIQSKVVSVYPNPFKENITFNISKGNDNSSLVIYDILSQEVFRTTVSDGLTIDLSFLKAGIYFYHLINDQGFTRSGKLVKN